MKADNEPAILPILFVCRKTKKCFKQQTKLRKQKKTKKNTNKNKRKKKFPLVGIEPQTIDV